MSIKKIRRNDPCPCNSGKKYKQCHGRNPQKTVVRGKQPTMLEGEKAELAATKSIKVMPDLAMPLRPPEHEIDAAAVRFILKTLPLAWTCQEKNAPEYGKDLLVEIFQHNQATACEFWIQAKGHQRLKLVYGDKIEQPLEVKTLNYLESHSLPVMIVVFSVEKQKAYFLWLKPYIHDVLDNKNPHWRKRSGNSQITIHVPLDNVFSEQVFGSIHAFVEQERQKALLNHSVDKSYPTYVLAHPEAEPLSYRFYKPDIVQYLERPHIKTKLIAGLKNCAVFIHADAGYGKTWLVYDTVKTIDPENILWFTFDSDVRDALQFTRELARGLYSCIKPVGARTLQYLNLQSTEISLGHAESILTDELYQSNPSVLLVIEDLHYAPSDVASLLRLLLITKPQNVQLILTSRHPLPLDTAKLTTQQVLKTFTRDDIALQFEETKIFIERNLNTQLTLEQVSQLHIRVEQWIAALSIATSALQDRGINEIAELFQRLSGFDGSIYDFFAEEVYAAFPSQTQWLLKRLGLARLFDSELVNQLLNRLDGGTLLRELHQKNSFLVKSGQSNYRFHSLFAEFLESRLLEEEGNTAKAEAHRKLAYYFSKIPNWYLVSEHSIKGGDYNVALQTLGKVAPTAFNLGYFQYLTEKETQIPRSYLEQAPELIELFALSALQTANHTKANQLFELATTLYDKQQDVIPLNRIRYFVAEAELDTNKITIKQFIEVCNDVVKTCYRKNEVFFGSQVELRAIRMSKLIVVSMDDSRPITKLYKQCEILDAKLESLGSEYDLLRAKAISIKAHLLFTIMFIETSNAWKKWFLSQISGNPVPYRERLDSARKVAELMPQIEGFYDQAEKMAEQNELHWGLIHLEHVGDLINFESNLKVQLNNPIVEPANVEQTSRANDQLNARLQWKHLPSLEKCRRIFEEHQMFEALAQVYCYAAEIFDVLDQPNERDKMAQKAFDIGKEKGLAHIVEKAEKILAGVNTYSSVNRQGDFSLTVGEVSSWTDGYKNEYLRYFLQGLGRDLDELQIQSVKLRIDEMVVVANERLNWCQNIDLLEDLERERLLNPLARKIIQCRKLGFTSPFPKNSFNELWPFFKGVYCLDCKHRITDSPDAVFLKPGES